VIDAVGNPRSLLLGFVMSVLRHLARPIFRRLAV
jgi:hypothetical protein